MPRPILSMVIGVEADIVAVRQRARHLAELFGFDRQDQTRIATALSEIARNAFAYAGGGRVEFALQDSSTPPMLVIRVIDRGKGIPDLDAVLEGRYRSPQGMGLGITGARRLLDHFRIESDASGTRVELGQRLPARVGAVSREKLDGIVAALSRTGTADPLGAVREQNHELLESLEELRRRQEEAAQLSRELGDTNRGVVALTAELEERAEQLRIASETKSKFLSNVSHELRTPLNSILALSRLLLDRVDGDLNEEQSRQIGYISASAQELLDIVNDLLDLAKVESGKIEARPSSFSVDDLFGALRGALKSLRADSNVKLIFDSASHVPELFTDEGKVTQILRNFISNALKFTEQGEVHVSAHYDSTAGAVTFAVADTGIGIAPEDQERIFEEFTQVDNRLQKASKGTGLGLPLSRRLAELLRGEVWVESELDRGSTFYLTVPIELTPRAAAAPSAKPRVKVLVVDDDETFRYVLRHILNQGGRYDVIDAVDGEHGLALIASERPDVVVLDLQMPRTDGYQVLERLRGAVDAPRTIISTSLQLSEKALQRLPREAPVLPKHEVSRDRLLALLEAVLED